MSGYGDRYSDPLDSAFSEEQSTAPIPREPPYFAGLNKEQREAVEAVDGRVLVLAGAGTGKTRVLTTRLAHILATRRAWPGQILSVTFTNKAAREMKERIGALIGGVVEGMQWLGTFHSIGARMLRRHAELAGLKPDFTILDADDQARLMKQQIQAEGIDEKRWPARQPAGWIDNWKNRGRGPKDLARRRGRQHPTFRKGFPGRDRDPPGTQLSLDRPHPRRRLAPHRPQREPARQDPLHRRPRPRGGEGLRRFILGLGGGSPRGRRGDRAAAAEGPQAQRDRHPRPRLLPDARLRRPLRHPRPQLPRHRRA